MRFTALIALGLLALAAAQAPNSLTPNLAFDLAAAPEGTYAGTKSILGQQVKSTMVVVSSSEANFSVTGPVTIECTNEDYAFEASSGLITFLKINQDGDCMHDALSKNHATLQSVKFDGKNSITIAIKVSVVTIKLVLTHQSEEEIKRHPELVAPAPASLPLFDLVDRFYDEYAGKVPSGKYQGSQSILGVKTTATIAVADAHFSLVLSGFKDLECDDEAYTYSNGVITVTNINKDGDCIHDNMEKDNLALKSISYDSIADTITVEIKAGVITLSFELAHVSGLVEVDFDALASQYLAIEGLSSGPSGNYKGSKTVLGQQVVVAVSTEPNSEFSLDITGIAAISCQNEPYSYSDGVLTPLNIGKKGDCLHDNFEENHIVLQSIMYSESADDITIKVKYTFVTLQFVLAKETASQLVHQAPPVPVSNGYPIPVLFGKFYKSFLGHDPTGTYKGSKTVLGQTFDASITISSSSELAFDVTGALTVECDNEDYEYANGVISFTKIGEPSDCLAQALESKGLTLKSVTYDTSADEITATLKKSFLSIELVLQHQ